MQPSQSRELAYLATTYAQLLSVFVRLQTVRIPKYRRHSTDRGFVEHERKRHYFPGAYKSPESWSAYKAWIRDLCGGFSPDSSSDEPAPKSIAALVSRWIKWAESYYSASGSAENLKHSCKLLVLHFGAMHPGDFGAKRLKELQHVAVKAGKSRDYVNSMTARVKRFFKWAVSEELVPPSVHHALVTVPGIAKGRTTARESVPRQPVSWDHFRAVLPFVNPTIRAMLLLQWHTGARPQSVRLARPEQFTLSVQPWEWRPRHKMEFAGKELVIFLGPQARKLIDPWLQAVHHGAYLFPPKTRKSKRYGKHYGRRSYTQAIVRGIAKANAARAAEDEPLPESEWRKPIPHWTPHQIRHSKGTNVRAKHGLEAAQATLGHDTLQAAQIYAQRQMDVARKIAEEEG